MFHIQLSDCLGCAVLLYLVCLFDLACFFLSSFSSLIKTCIYKYCIKYIKTCTMSSCDVQQKQSVSSSVGGSGGGGAGEKGKGGGGESDVRRTLSRQHAKDISEYTKQILAKDRELDSLRKRLGKVENNVHVHACTCTCVCMMLMRDDIVHVQVLIWKCTSFNFLVVYSLCYMYVHVQERSV